MPRESDSLRLLGALNGSYKPGGEEVFRLARLALLNKLYLAYLRRVGDLLRDELLHEEARYRWFKRSVAEVIGVLERVGATYALYKFRRPFEHVSVDLDLLVRVEDAPRAVKALAARGFKVAVFEPYTVTLERRGFIVDLYTHPSFAWAIYMDGRRLLSCCVEEIEVGGVSAKTLSREAEVVVAATHAVYKEHVVLLVDCLTAWAWATERALSLARELDSETPLKILLNACDMVKRGFAEAPYKLKLHTITRIYLDKALRDPVFRGTMPNMLIYVLRQRSSGAKILSRITRESY